MNSPKAITTSQLSPDEARALRLYGRLPSQPSHHLARHLKDRKYFDSGDYALSKAGRGNSVDVGAVGVLHPEPQNIPHVVSPDGLSGGGMGKRRKSSLSGSE